MFEIQRNTAFVASGLQENRACIVADRAGEAVFTATWLLDSNYIGTEIAKQRCALRAGDIAGKIENFNAFEDCSVNHWELHNGSQNLLIGWILTGAAAL